MKTTFSFWLVLLFMHCTFFTEAQSTVPSDQDWEISLGKRKNRILSRQISEINLGNTFTSYNPVYFKIGEKGEWQKVGLRGDHVLPYIPSTDFSQLYFKKFKQKKTISYWCLGINIASTIAWGVASIDYGVQNNSNIVKTFLNPRSLALLTGAIASNIIGVVLNSKADMDLFMAVNGDKVKEEKPELSFHLGVLESGGIGLQMAF